MPQLVPPFILQNHAQGNYRGEFPAVGLFVDIVGFSKMTDALMQHGQHGAEVLARIMRSVFGLPSLGIYEQGGFIVGYAGDAFTALFPCQAEAWAETSLRALAAAWNIQQQISAWPVYETEYGSFPISAKVGLAHGAADWGILRSRDGSRATYFFRGTAVNNSAQAEHQAQAGEIILARGLSSLAPRGVEVAARGEFERLVSLTEFPEPGPIPPHTLQPQALEDFFPASLLHQHLLSEFRQALNVFLSLPVLTDDALAAFLELVFELQSRYGGLFTRVDFGDKGCNLLFFWGAPVSYENDVERALNFVFELRQKTDFKFTAGVTYYISRAGLMGSDLMEEYTCYGWGINLAARLMLTAPRGEIWLDERVATRADRHFETETIGEQNFKGFAEKQKVFSLRGRRERTEAFFQGQFVGREPEIARLTEFVAPLWRGEGAGSLTVWGEPGMGKSRLLYEFQVSPVFVQERALWAFCQSDQLLAESFNPFSYWLRRYFGFAPNQEPAEKQAAVRAKVMELLAATSAPALVEDLSRADSFLAALVDVSWPDSLYEQMDARARYDNTFVALTALIKAESLRQPLILFLEDAQYLDDDSTAFLRFLWRSLASETNSYPVAILSAARHEGSGLPLDPILLQQEIDLDRLSRESLSRLAEARLGGPLAADLLNLLEVRADGNPFFVEQILRYLDEEALLKPGVAGWELLTASQREITLPLDIKAILVARLDQLTREVKNVIQTASVLGREFEIRILAQMLHDDPFVAAEIHAAEQAAVWLALNEIRYIFKHALLRDAAYTMQMQARRQELHALALEALEKVFSDQFEAHLGELAYHAEQAGLTEKACQYLEQAGDQARNAYQNAVAADYYIRALALIPVDDVEVQYRLRLRLDDVYDQIGNREVQKHNLEQIRQIAVTTNDIHKLAEVSKLETAYLVFIGEFLQAIEHAKETLELAQQVGNKEITMRTYAYLVSSLHFLGKNAEAIEHAEIGLHLAREIGHLNGEAQQLNIYGLIALKLRDPETARARFELSLELYRQINNLRGEADPLSNLGLVYAYLSDYAIAHNYYEKALFNAREVGHRALESQYAESIGWVLGLQGDLEQALTYLERGLRLARETAHHRSELYSLLNLSAYSELLGKFEAALDYAEQALFVAREINDQTGEAWTQNYRGHALLALGRLAEARAAYQAALKLNRALKLLVEATEPTAGLARIALQGGDLATAKRQVAPILVQMERDPSLSGTDQPLRVYQTCYNVLRATNSERARAVLDIAYQLLMARSNSIKDETLRRTFLENIPYHREILSDWNTQQGGTQ